MKVVRVIARLNVGGPAKHVVWLTKGLQSKDCETLLVAGTVPAGEDDMGYFATAMGVSPYFLQEMSREVSLKDAVTIWKLYRIFRRERPDIIHTHTAKAGTVGRLAGLLYRWLTPGALLGQPRPCRFVHTYHGHIFHSYYGPLKTRLFLVIEKLLAKLVTDRIVVITDQQRREINEEFGVGRADRFTVIPLGLDLEVFAGWRDRGKSFRDELGAKDDEVLVGIVGRLTEIKNHELFLKAAAEYKGGSRRQEAGDTRQEAGSRRQEAGGTNQEAGSRRQGAGDTKARAPEPEVRFVIVGDGALRSRLEQQAKSLGLTDDVAFVGTRQGIEDVYPALDIVALTSLNEGTPLTLIEAMANARPVISTMVGGVVDLLGVAIPEQPAQSFVICERGVGVPSNDARAFAQGLAHLAADVGLRREIGERGLQFVTDHYSKERLLEDVRALYADLLKEK